MKLTKKLLMPLGLGLMSGITAAASLASCSKTPTEVKAFAEATYIVGNASYETAYFSVNKYIADDNVVTISSKSDNFEFELLQIYANNTICVKISRKASVTERTEEKLDIQFVCKDKSGNVVFDTVLKDYTVVYTTGIAFDEAQKTSVADWNSTAGYAHKSYKFTLESELSEGISVKIDLARNDATSSPDSYVSLISTNVQQKELTVDVKVTGNAEGIDKTSFNMTISLVDESGYTIYSPCTIKNFTLTYVTGNTPIPEDAFTWDETGDVAKITAFDTSKMTESQNCLVLPARSPNQNKPYTFESTLFTDTASNATTKLLSNIKILKIVDITAVQLPADAFNNAPFTAFDLNSQLDKSSRYKQDINQVTFGARSLQFANAAGKGEVLFNNTFTTDERMVLEAKMWGAGLTSPDWYSSQEVKNEAELKAAAEVGGNIFLTQDIKLTDSIEFNNTSAILNLYGHKIYSESAIYTTSNKKFGLIRVHNSNLTVYDSSNGQAGTIEPYEVAAGVNGQCAIECWSNSSETKTTSTLKIFSGTYWGNKIDKQPTMSGETTNTAIYNQGAKLYIKSIYNNDGSELFCPKFKTNAKDSNNVGRYLIDCDDDSITSQGTAIEVSGGEFYSTVDTQANHIYNPAYAWADKPDGNPSNWVKTGYTSTLISDHYKVSKN